MHTRDSRGRQITVGAPVRWQDPPHFGSATRHGTVVEPIKGGWFRIRENEPGTALAVQRIDGDPLVKPISLTIDRPDTPRPAGD